MIKRNRSIDIIKGIAIYCVLWGHCIQSMADDATFFKLGAVKFIYSFHMPLFIMVSGYLFFATSRKSELQIIKSRLTSLAIPFFVWNFLLYARRCIFEVLTTHSIQFSFIEMARSLVSGLWFLKSLFIITMLMTLIVKHCRKYRYLCTVVIWVALIVFSNIFGDHTADLFPFFALGYYIAERAKIQEKIFKCRYVVWIIFVLLLLGMKEEYFVYVGGINPLLSKYGFARQIYFDFYRLGIGITGSFSIALLVKQVDKYLAESAKRFLEKLGRNTLQLYVLQSFFLEGVLSQIIAHFSLPGGVDAIYLMEWIIAPIVAGAYALVLMIGIKIIGKIPYLSTVLFGVKKQKQSC